MCDVDLSSRRGTPTASERCSDTQGEQKDPIAPPFDLCEGKYKTDVQVRPRVVLVDRAPSSFSTAPALEIHIEDASEAASIRIQEMVSVSLKDVQSYISGFNFSLVYPVRTKLAVNLPDNDAAKTNEIRQHVTTNILPALQTVMDEFPVDLDKPEPGFVITTDPQLGFFRNDVIGLLGPLVSNVSDVFCGVPTAFHVTPKYLQACWADIVSHLFCAVNDCEYSLASWYFVHLQTLFQKFPLAWLSLFPSLSRLLAEYLLVCFPRSITYTILHQHLAVAAVTPTGSQLKDPRLGFVVDVLRAFTPTVLYDQAMSILQPTK